MKILIFTPATMASSIGGCTSVISKALHKRGHEVVVVRTEIEPCLSAETHEFDGLCISWSDIGSVQANAAGADLIFYQIGDNYQYHAGSLEWMERLPGNVILHDFFIGHLFWAWAQRHRERADKILRAWYGEDIASRYFDFTESYSFIGDTQDSAPMTEWICSMAQGVITHAHWGVERVIASCPGPVRVIPLCHNKPMEKAGAVTKLEAPGSFQVLTIGHANRNKRIPSVIEAIGSSDILRKETCYRLVGAIDPNVSEEYLMLAEHHGVNLEILGKVNDRELARIIDQADAVTCLRWPALEAASGSLVEALLNGKPTIVTNTGFYAELPDDVVMKVNPQHEVADISDALQHLLQNYQAGQIFGKRARDWAWATFSPEDYADQIIDAAIEVSKARPLINTANYFVDLMKRWEMSEGGPGWEASILPLRIFMTRN